MREIFKHFLMVYMT